MEKIDISKSVKSIDFGKQYGVRVQRIFQTNGKNEDMRLPKSFLFTSICQHIML